MDHEAIARELVRALRGRRSQVAFSRRLGYASNVLYTWESGRRWPAASTFLGAAQRAGIEVEAKLRAFAGPPPWPAGVAVASPEGVACLLASLKGNTPIQQIAARADRSRFAVSRWLRGQSEPRLPDLLRLVQAASLRGLDFVALFADPAGLPSARAAWRRLENARTLAWSSPWAQAVLLALELVAYQALPRHDPGWLARRLSLPLGDVRSALKLLLESGQIQWRGPRLVPVEVQSVDVRRPASDTRLKQHWSRVGLERLAHGLPGTWSYNVFAVSETDLARIEELQRAHYRAIRTVVADSSPTERVVLVNLQIVPLDGA